MIIAAGTPGEWFGPEGSSYPRPFVVERDADDDDLWLLVRYRRYRQARRRPPKERRSPGGPPHMSSKPEPTVAAVCPDWTKEFPTVAHARAWIDRIGDACRHEHEIRPIVGRTRSGDPVLGLPISPAVPSPEWADAVATQANQQ